MVEHTSHSGFRIVTKLFSEVTFSYHLDSQTVRNMKYVNYFKYLVPYKLQNSLQLRRQYWPVEYNVKENIEDVELCQKTLPLFISHDIIF